MEVVDVAAEQRWTTWKLEAARLDTLRAARMHQLFAVVFLAPVLWLLWRLFTGSLEPAS